MAINEENEAELKIGDLKQYSKNIDTIVKVVSKTEPREVVSRKDDSTHRIAEALVGDDSGSIYLNLWNEDIDRVVEDQILRIENAYVNLFRGSMRLNIGRYGKFEVIDEAPFEEVNLDNNLSSIFIEDWRQSQRSFGRRNPRQSGRSGRRY